MGVIVECDSYVFIMVDNSYVMLFVIWYIGRNGKIGNVVFIVEIVFEVFWFYLLEREKMIWLKVVLVFRFDKMNRIWSENNRKWDKCGKIWNWRKYMIRDKL